MTMVASTAATRWRVELREGRSRVRRCHEVRRLDDRSEHVVNLCAPRQGAIGADCGIRLLAIRRLDPYFAVGRTSVGIPAAQP
jgi:hypothetical protein